MGEDIRPTQNELKEKVFNSLKHTFFFLLLCGVLIAFGLFFRKEENILDKFKESPGRYKWIENLLDTDSYGQRSVSFVISILGVIGMTFLIFYTGYGLGALPFYLIKGKKDLSVSHQEVELDIFQNRTKIKNYQEKNITEGQLSTKENKELNRLKENETNLDWKLNKINSLIESD